jgi:Zn-dependent peptidase ImmA (M78 family)/DNA-binding XRE family transcriptional regulator
MPEKSLSIKINPDVFKWLRESSGWSQEEIAKRLNTSIDSINKIENGQKQPTIKQLNELSNIFKRPVAAFFLDEPKHEKPKPKDYRLLPNKKGKFDKKTIFVLRKARRMQELCRELSLYINYETKAKIKKVKITENPEKLANYYRNLFEITKEKQRKFKSPYELFNYLRDILEDMNIFVFQYSMPVEDARGFVFVDESPFIIAVNTKDSIEARLFSLMHEFGHILLGESAIDLPDITLNSRNTIEKWCNEFASSFLLPKDIAIELFNNKDLSIETISNKYKISKQMILVNMLKLDYIEKEEYERILNLYKPKIKTKKESKKQGGIPSEKKRLSEFGNKFVSLVANNYDKENITYNDALNYLSIKSKNFDSLLSKAMK